MSSIKPTDLSSISPAIAPPSALTTIEEKVVHHLVSSIVKYPSEVHVFTQYRGRREVICIEADPRDRPLIIGRKGRHAEALRTVIKGIDKDVRIEIL